MQLNGFANSRLNYLIDFDDFNVVDNGSGNPQNVYFRRASGIEVNLMVDPSSPKIILFSKVPVVIAGRLLNLRNKRTGVPLLPTGTFYTVAGVSPNVGVDNVSDGYLIRATQSFLGSFEYEFEEDQVG